MWVSCPKGYGVRGGGQGHSIIVQCSFFGLSAGSDTRSLLSLIVLSHVSGFTQQLRGRPRALLALVFAGRDLQGTLGCWACDIAGDNMATSLGAEPVER